jgi:hypothetical protein
VITSDVLVATSSAQAAVSNGKTTYSYVTYTYTSHHLISGSALAGSSGSKSKSNTGAIVGGVVGGVGGAALLACIAGYFLWKRKKARAVAFDDKMFDPDLATRHSAADNLDFMGAAAAPAVTSPGDLGHVDPYPYDHTTQGGSYEHHGYDQAYEQQAYDHGYDYSNPQGSMAMPDARDYQPYTGAGYENYGDAAAYAGVGAAGAVAGHHGGQHDFSDDPYAAAPTPAAAAKAQEAERERALSPGMQSNTSAMSARYEDAVSNQDHTDAVYHNAAYHDAHDVHGDNMNEIPPK